MREKIENEKKNCRIPRKKNNNKSDHKVEK